jgi:copper chaperone for superoxide dismutase
MAAGAAMVAVEATASPEVSQMAPGQGKSGVGAKAELPDLMTEFMVDMKCEGCVKSVRTKLEPLAGVKSVDVNLENQVVRVLGSTTVKDLTAALAESGRKARLIGQGLPENFTLSAAVAEFKGPQIHGVVRFAQVSMELLRVEASFSGLPQGSSVGWSINEYGDLTRGAASTGQIFSGSAGDLGVLEVNNDGVAEYTGTKEKLQVRDMIGRAVVVYGDTDKSKSGIAAAVIARSAGVGENYKKLCLCDGTVIWESSNSDFVKA